LVLQKIQEPLIKNVELLREWSLVGVKKIFEIRKLQIIGQKEREL